MAIPENDLELLHAYLDGEMPVSECEGLWRRLAVEADLSAELDRLRSEHAIRRMVWSALEPPEKVASRLEVKIVREAHRQAVMGTLRRLGTIGISLAACILFGFTVGWLGRERYSVPHGNDMVVNTSDGQPSQAGGYVVNMRDNSGRDVALQHFNTLDEAQQFVKDLAQWQGSRQQSSQDPMVVPVSGKF